MSPNAMNDNPRWNSFVILPLTTRSKLRSPTIVSFQQGVAGLPEDSSVLCHQITTVDRSKFGEYIGAFQPSELESIEQGLLAALGIL
jgi:mRNA interferase MazF